MHGCLADFVYWGVCCLGVVWSWILVFGGDNFAWCCIEEKLVFIHLNLHGKEENMLSKALYRPRYLFDNVIGL